MKCCNIYSTPPSPPVIPKRVPGSTRARPGDGGPVRCRGGAGPGLDRQRPSSTAARAAACAASGEPRVGRPRPGALRHGARGCGGRGGCGRGADLHPSRSPPGGRGRSWDRSDGMPPRSSDSASARRLGPSEPRQADSGRPCGSSAFVATLYRPPLGHAFHDCTTLRR